MNFEPKLSRTVYFVRHGQYKKDPECLTPLGRKQARLIASALREIKPHQLISSTMPRAVETAAIIGKTLKKRSKRRADLIEGVLPGMQRKGFSSKRFRTDQKRAERAYRFISKCPRRNEKLVIVAHGNVIRYWACKALGVNPNRWVRMDVLQCSLTILRFHPKGPPMLLAFNESGHIPKKLLTFL